LAVGVGVPKVGLSAAPGATVILRLVVAVPLVAPVPVRV
jgi:hypothetical protein